MRVYLTGGVAIEHEEKLVEERELAGRQGRLAFAFLASERHRPITKDELVAVVWPDTPPREIETALSAILSKLRTAFRKVIARGDRRGAIGHDPASTAGRRLD